MVNTMQTITLNNVIYTTEQIVTHYNNAQIDGVAVAQNTCNAVQAMHQKAVTTFANVVQVTQVATSAKYRALTILKVSSVNALFSSSASTYTNAVKNSASKHAVNNAGNVQDFTASRASFTRTSIASIAHSNKTSALQIVYLTFSNMRSANKTFYVCGQTLQVLCKNTVAQYLTASASNALLNPSNTIHNVTNDVTHSVHTRSVNMHNVLSITANKTTTSNLSLIA
jgi:hypothetical protein